MQKDTKIEDTIVKQIAMDSIKSSLILWVRISYLAIFVTIGGKAGNYIFFYPKVVHIMRDNLDNIIKRDDKLNTLEKRSGKIILLACLFGTHARKVYWKKRVSKQ